MGLHRTIICPKCLLLKISKGYNKAMKTIQLTKGKVALVDDANFEWLNRWPWHCSHYGYAARRMTIAEDPTRRMVWMHRLIDSTPEGMMTDHINQDKLDNRRSNLRSCTKQTNAVNSKTRADNTSGYRGVTWDKIRRKWVAQLHVMGKSMNLGGYSDKKQAALAYNQAALNQYGEFANLNEVT